MDKKDTLSIKSKLLTIFFTSIITLIIFETILQFASFVFKLKSSVKIENRELKKGYYTILCIGSSNTAGVKIPDFKTDDYSYPTLLFRLLNKENQDIKYKIVNEGIPGATTFTLLVNLENNIKKYNPDLIICMIGGNDTFLTGNYKKSNKVIDVLKNLKIFRILFEGIYRLHIYFYKNNPFEIRNLKDQQYYIDKIGHYLPVFDPWIFLKEFGIKYKKEIKESILHLKNGRIKDAIALAEKAIEKDKNSIANILYLAEIYSQIENYDKAIEIYKMASKMNKEPLILLKLARQYELSGKYYEAEKLYKELLDNFNENNIILLTTIPFYQELLSIAEENRDKYSDEYRRTLDKIIIDYCYSAIKREPNNLLGYLLLGKHYNHKGELDKAIESLKIAFSFENKNAYYGYFTYQEQPARYLADSYSDIGNYQSAIETLKPLLKYQNPAIYRHLANIYKKSSNTKESDGLLRQAKAIEDKEENKSFKENYRKICEISLSNSIKIIAMENPNKSTEKLKKILEGINGVIVVSNEENFKKALKEDSYEKYFEDLSAGDYGHCTKEGNMLIAENLLPFILEELK